MKKLILLASLLLSFSPAYSQTEEANRVVLHGKDGKIHAFTFESIEYMDFDNVGEVSLAASVVDGSVKDTSFSISVSPSAECASYTIVCNDSDPASHQGAQTIMMEDLVPETNYTVTLTPFDKYMIPGEAVVLTARTLATQTVSDPKVGDYFYSDGTWSDGGLISIDLTGQNAVWADNKPAPIEGKTVVGIVCNVDPARIAPEDKAAGFTHGYVIACKNATDPGKSNYSQYPESIWYGAPYSEIDVTKVTKIGKSCYERVSGSVDTRDMLAAYPDNPAVSVPMFYYCTSGFPVAAPENTSGWFVPSIGQLWDCIANFCSGAVADRLYEARTLSYDFTAYFSEQTQEPVLDNFMKVFELVPEADKDAITMNDSNRKPTSVALRSCNRYDSESAVHFNLGTDEGGLIEGMAGWFDEEGHARPMLAF